jgi:hypothetical protein
MKSYWEHVGNRIENLENMLGTYWKYQGNFFQRHPNYITKVRVGNMSHLQV